MSTSSRIVSFTRGRPGPRRWLPSYFAAMSSQCQRNDVSGVTRSAISSRFSRHNAFAFAARRRRWSLVKRRRRAPSCSRSTRFSSFRYSITSCWDRLTQPAKVNARNCHRWGCIGRVLAARSTGATLALRKRHPTPLCFAPVGFWHTTPTAPVCDRGGAL